MTVEWTDSEGNKDGEGFAGVLTLGSGVRWNGIAPRQAGSGEEPDDYEISVDVDDELEEQPDLSVTESSLETTEEGGEEELFLPCDGDEQHRRGLGHCRRHCPVARRPDASRGGLRFGEQPRRRGNLGLRDRVPRARFRPRRTGGVRLLLRRGKSVSSLVADERREQAREAAAGESEQMTGGGASIED